MFLSQLGWKFRKPRYYFVYTRYILIYNKCRTCYGRSEKVSNALGEHDQSVSVGEVLDGDEFDENGGGVGEVAGEEESEAGRRGYQHDVVVSEVHDSCAGGAAEDKTDGIGVYHVQPGPIASPAQTSLQSVVYH